MFELHSGLIYKYESEINITGRACDYIPRDKVKVYHNEELGNKSIYTLASVKSAINYMIFNHTDGYKKEEFPESNMLQNLSYITVTDHDGYIIAELHSNVLDYGVDLIINAPDMKRGDIVG